MNLRQATRILLYSSDFCGYCKKAEAFFKNNGVQYEKLDVLTEEGEKAFDETKKKYNHKTIPMIFVNDEFIGGYDDLMKKVENGEYVV